MQEYETGAIREYGKRDLFRRFALDNFAAIHKLHLLPLFDYIYVFAKADVIGANGAKASVLLLKKFRQS